MHMQKLSVLDNLFTHNVQVPACKTGVYFLWVHDCIFLLKSDVTVCV
uniref:Uncharacterized protein n=1 Tax=Triticum urartu TaxID=4572 RepID=A0A8R7UKL4_TRIUA